MVFQGHIILLACLIWHFTSKTCAQLMFLYYHVPQPRAEWYSLILLSPRVKVSRICAACVRQMKTAFCAGLTPVPTTALAMGSAHLGTLLPAECTVNVTSTGRARPVTSPTAGTTAAAPTMATATLLGRNCVSAMTAGKVRVIFADHSEIAQRIKSAQIVLHGAFEKGWLTTRP